jgi:hypothetical protein
VNETSDETREFLSRLYRATQEKKLSWVARSQTSFAVETSGGDVTLRSRDSDDRHPYVLTITNESGISVVNLITGEGDLPENYDDGIADLYRMVKNSALGISSTLDSIAKALDLDD